MRTIKHMAALCAISACLSCHNQIDINSNDEEGYVLMEVKNKLFLQFSPSIPYNVDWEKWSVDWEEWQNLINNHPTLQKYEANGNYAFLESKDGKPISLAIIEYFIANPLIGSASYPFEAPVEFGYIGVLQGIRNEIVAKLKEKTSFVQLQILAEQNGCTVTGEDNYVKNQFFVNVPKNSSLNAMQMSKLFYKTDLFESVQPTFVMLNLLNSFCEDKRIIKIFKDEPAIVQKTCFEHVGRVESFFFELAKNHSELHSQRVFPIANVPEQFRKEGLSVKISGNAISCLITGGCIEPNIRIAPINLFEIKSIKINN